MSFIARFLYGEIAFQVIVNLKMCREIEIETERLDDMLMIRKKNRRKGKKVLLQGIGTVQSLPNVKSLPHFFCMIQWVDCSNFSQIERLCTKILYSFCRTKKFGLQRLKELL